MDAPPIHPFVMEILTLTTQCINAESSHLESWMCNKQNPLVALQLKILGGSLTEDEDEKTPQDDSKQLTIDIKETPKVEQKEEEKKST